jgi:DNA-directed RNA polymerase sigma subunit (sigma70/sigma32)
VSGRADRNPDIPARLPRVSLDGFGEPELTALDERSAHVLRMRTGMVDGRCRTLKEVGEELGIRQEWVRQIQMKGLANIPDDREKQRHMDSADSRPRPRRPKASS